LMLHIVMFDVQYTTEILNESNRLIKIKIFLDTLFQYTPSSHTLDWESETYV